MAKRTVTRSRGLSGLSVGDLQAEIARRERQLGKLRKKHAAAMKKVEAIEREIIANGGGIGGSRRLSFGGPGVNLGRKRPKNDMNLVEALAKTLKGKTMGVTEVAEIGRASCRERV